MIKLNFRESQIYSLISTATIEKPISATEIFQVIKIESSEVRSVVHSLRKKGVPVCAFMHGYFMPDDIGELHVYLRQLNGRIQKQLDCHRALSLLDDVNDYKNQIVYSDNFEKMNEYIQLSLEV